MIKGLTACLKTFQGEVQVYRTMSTDHTICHGSDIRQLPAGAIIIKCVRNYAYEIIRYKMLDGKIREVYSPFTSQPEIIDVVPGTHAFGFFGLFGFQ